MTSSVVDIKTTAQIFADSITTIVSDSGIIRYRIITPEWYVYEKADTPFRKGTVGKPKIKKRKASGA